MKFGSVPFANAAPLTWGLPDQDLLSRDPVGLAALLDRGEAAAALVPVASLFSHPDWIAAPSYGIACRGPVLSVKVFFDRELDFDQLSKLKRIAVPKGSVSSTTLLSLLLKTGGSRAELIPVDPTPSLPSGCDAILRIGDEALLHEAPGLDLGEAWLKLTGLPFVFARWVQAEEIPLASERLKLAAETGLKRLEDIALKYRPRLGGQSLRYFTEALVYRLGAAEDKGMEEFRLRLRDAGLLPAGKSGIVAPSPRRPLAPSPVDPISQSLDPVYAKFRSGERLSPEDALALFQEADLITLGELATEKRNKRNDPGTVTYVVDRNLNYSNVCVATCSFCAFYRPPGHGEGYLLSWEEVDQKVAEAVSLGASQILMQGGLHPDLPLSYYEDLIRAVKKHPVRLHGFSPPEIAHFARVGKTTVPRVLERFIQAGLDSIPGGGAEILVDEVRDVVARGKCLSDEWLAVMEEAHRQGLRSSATMMFGHVESLAHRVEHLTRLRELQDRTGGFIAFIPWTFVPGPGTELRTPPKGGSEYLKTLAISTLYLDNIPHFQASWVAQTAKVGQLALSFGADDFGNVMIEEQVVASAGGLNRCLSEAEIRRLIAEMGFAPRRRDTLYNLLPEPAYSVLGTAR